MRHLGWLHATPKGSEKSRLATFKGMREDHPMLEMPDLESDHAAGYLIGLLFEAGLMSSNGMGPVPISWSEICAWLEATELDVSVWDKLTVKALSEEYVSSLLQSTGPETPAPYVSQGELLARQRKITEENILSSLSMFMRKGPAN